MEIKTCEQYVLAELSTAQKRVSELEEEIKTLKETLKEYSFIVNGIVDRCETNNYSSGNSLYFSVGNRSYDSEADKQLFNAIFTLLPQQEEKENE